MRFPSDGVLNAQSINEKDSCNFLKTNEIIIKKCFIYLILITLHMYFIIIIIIILLLLLLIFLLNEISVDLGTESK